MCMCLIGRQGGVDERTGFYQSCGNMGVSDVWVV